MYEYKVIMAPASPRRGFFAKTTSFADILSDAINEQALDNWEYQRAEAGLDSKANVLVFRKKIEKVAEDMAQPRSFSDRLLESENKGKQEQREAGQDYSGPIRPRRARVLLDQSGTMTERPENIDPETIDLDTGSYDTNNAAERVTPFKPKSAATANV